MIRLAAAAFALTMLSAGAQAVETFETSRDGRMTARLTAEGIGYSVVRHNREGRASCHRVTVTCPPDGRFSQACCPTMDHVAVCPTARIACR